MEILKAAINAFATKGQIGPRTMKRIKACIEENANVISDDAAWDVSIEKNKDGFAVALHFEIMTRPGDRIDSDIYSRVRFRTASDKDGRYCLPITSENFDDCIIAGASRTISLWIVRRAGLAEIQFDHLGVVDELMIPIAEKLLPLLKMKCLIGGGPKNAHVNIYNTVTGNQ